MLQTRKPTGNPAWPLVLVEGEEKAGKSYALAQLSASPLVGRTFVWDLGDGTMDEYGTLGRYEIVETTGTFTDLRDSIREAVAIPPEGGKPNVYGIDSGTDLWELLKRWTDGRARESKNGRAKLREDPDAEIDPSMNLWNDAKDRWAEIVNLLLRAPGIGVITAQGGEVVLVENGAPTTKKTWSVQAEKTIPRVATAWVRVRRDPRSATLVGVRRLGLDLPAGGLALPLEDTIHNLVFEVIGAGAQFATPTVTRTQVGMSASTAKARIVGAVKANLQLPDDEAVAEAAVLWLDAGLGHLKGSDEAPVQTVADLITGITDRQLPPEAPRTAEERAEDHARAIGESEGSVPVGDESGADAGEPPKGDLSEIVKGMSKPEVKAALERRGLPVDGDVSTLRARLLAALVAPVPDALAAEFNALVERSTNPDLTVTEREEIADRLVELEERADSM